MALINCESIESKKVHRLKVVIRGAVQGVGFRPFIYRLATELNLTGWVLNSAQGVFIEVEGVKDKLDEFLLRIENEKPPRSFIQSLEFSFLDPLNYDRFEIRHSDAQGEKDTIVLPDVATCKECINEIFDPSQRRYLYPFTNCTNCGPRFSIIEALPYDRQNTTMNSFKMCRDCRSEYENPLDRRFHAQPIACPVCGPHLELWDKRGNLIASYEEALLQTAEYICSGKIIAIKGLGGFHLVVDARNDEAVLRLRERKHREEKPFALMYPSLEMAKQDCEISILEERLLNSPESPIVLLKRKSQVPNPVSQISSYVAPNNPYLGIMLPYTPLHHILMKELQFPIVATSGNISDEPICIDEYEALDRLGNIADVFLVHNRQIKRHVDDSIVRVMMEREIVLRRARGYAPLPVTLKPCNYLEAGSQIEDENAAKVQLAVGAHLKNTVAISKGENVFISQHIGDLETKQAFDAFEDVISSLKRLYEIDPKIIVCDLHPGYHSTQYAHKISLEIEGIQHHYAHIASCMAENQLEGQVMGISWDGSGYGLDSTIWGGEFILTNKTSFERVATFKQFKLLGGEKAIKEPRRTAIGVLFELFGETLFGFDNLLPLQSCSAEEKNIFQQMLSRNINTPVTSSVGRLFDAVASIVGIRQRISFEGQAAMELEWAIGDNVIDSYYEWSIRETNIEPRFIVDWSNIFHGIIKDMNDNMKVSIISAKFHNTLVEIIIEIAKRIGEKRVVLSGGCFQNKYLTERAVKRLEEEGFKAYWHQRVPPNDGGISLGQIYAYNRLLSNRVITQSEIEISDLNN